MGCSPSLWGSSMSRSIDGSLDRASHRRGPRTWRSPAWLSPSVRSWVSGSFHSSPLPVSTSRTRGSVLVNDDVGTSVLLVSIDTLRADRLSVYGYPRTTTPFLEKLAKDSVVFEKVLSPASWTLPAHASLLTGKLPGRHGARFVGLPDGRHRGQCRLPPPQPRHGPGVRAL